MPELRRWQETHTQVLTVNDAELLDGLFRQAVAAIDAGDAVILERLLAEHPRLVRERLESPGEWLRSQIDAALNGFFRHPYLLWFVTEDAVRWIFEFSQLLLLCYVPPGSVRFVLDRMKPLSPPTS